MKQPALFRCQIVLAFLMAAASLKAQEANPEMLKILSGQQRLRSHNPDSASPDGSKAQSGPATALGFKTRGARPSPTSPAAVPAPIRTEERQVYFTTRGVRGIPRSIAAHDRPQAVGATGPILTPVQAPAANLASRYGELSVAPGEEAYRLSYRVDPTSKLSATAIKFVKGSVELADEASRRFLGELAATLKHPSLAGFKYVIEGHASAEGAAMTNQDLSQARANEIFRYLINSGVQSDRILPVGFGETQARFPDSSPETVLAEDRRVLIFKLE